MFLTTLEKEMLYPATALGLTLLASTTAVFALDGPSDADIKRQIIAESIASYPGPCACPYNVARNGSSCGRRSAYSRPGGYAPICYDIDITSEMVQNYRLRHKVSY